MRVFVLLVSLVMMGCSSSGPSNILDDANQTALDEYEQALADADKMMESDTELEE